MGFYFVQFSFPKNPPGFLLKGGVFIPLCLVLIYQFSRVAVLLLVLGFGVVRLFVVNFTRTAQSHAMRSGKVGFATFAALGCSLGQY